MERFLTGVILTFLACGVATGQGPATAVVERHAAAQAGQWSRGRWIDLTHSFDEKTIYWPTEKGFRFEQGMNGPTPKGYYYAANRFASAEHGGTHLDAPRHFSAAGETADAIPLEHLVGEAVVVDVTKLRFPGLSPLAAQWLVDHRRIRAIGIDTASIDHGPSTHFGAHVVLCTGNVPIFENVATLDALPEQGAFVIALPMKIAGGSGGPLRIVARLPDTAD